MNNLLGRVIDVKMTDENEKYYFLQNEGVVFQLDKTESIKPLHIGGHFQGFAYENEDHKLQITSNVPKIQVGRMGFGTVVQSRRDLGVFVDIGLPNKDMVVSLDELPTIKSLWPQQGDHLMISLRIDRKNRMWGTLADETTFQEISQKAPKTLKNKNLKATVYRLKLVGTLVITSDYYLGFIHPNERDQEPRLGEEVSARVIGIHPDGTLNLSLKPRSYEAIGDDAAMLLAMLQHDETHALPFTDKSSPAEIKTEFGISKGQFKRAVGHLLKAGAVTQEDGQLKLKEEVQ
ncbi:MULTISPECIES: S1-like domain-containing RNA-binding protein [Pediococcus]|jgi:predicted RNA-binding protein (virulence factor B family)|uniref:DNA-binding protein n=1 Tax=Pediococcus parvulus TaxID=54062 RepID=A0A176TLS2_9LACO|nr:MULTISPECIES: S1-like domain-containing RNA-binding protein [Pediococcus]MCT3026443.1 DNA-binding protein [Pediococcus parvulus]MCT3028525.1 DNA-binding protein [Pediococcus parvulus]MCT3031394.1 DNA-binding protein [Pediococcus parvulus]MCT3034160.1 DNA-binding protein [Pediococcus parvulus]MDV7693680.1 DNA-binding protein [Pediococcus parvulus]